MRKISGLQILASAMNKSKSKIISVSQLVRYNDILLGLIEDYHQHIDIYDLAFEIASVAPEFCLTVDENHLTVLTLSEAEEFDYEIYIRTLPKHVVDILETVELPA